MGIVDGLRQAFETEARTLASSLASTVLSVHLHLAAIGFTSLRGLCFTDTGPCLVRLQLCWGSFLQVRRGDDRLEWWKRTLDEELELKHQDAQPVGDNTFAGPALQHCAGSSGQCQGPCEESAVALPK
eukprot:1363215-Amphidinium_carterae.1